MSIALSFSKNVFASANIIYNQTILDFSQGTVRVLWMFSYCIATACYKFVSFTT